MGLDDPLDPPCSHCGATTVATCGCHWDHPVRRDYGCGMRMPLGPSRGPSRGDPVAALANSSAHCARLQEELADMKRTCEMAEEMRDQSDKRLAEMTSHRDDWVAVARETGADWHHLADGLLGRLPWEAEGEKDD